MGYLSAVILHAEMHYNLGYENRIILAMAITDGHQEGGNE